MSDEIPTRIPASQSQEHVNTKQPVFRPKTNREVHMEDLKSAQLAFFDSLQKRGIEIPPEDENAFWDSMSLFLEESFGWPDYASHN